MNTTNLAFAIGLVSGVGALYLVNWLRARFSKHNHWVGVSRYEGPDPKAAAMAFAELQSETDRIVGRVEWFHVDKEIRAFKVV